MALPVDSRTATNLYTSTIDQWLDSGALADDFFLSNPVAVRMIERDNVTLDGGAFVRQNLIYAATPAGSHATGTPYDISLPQFMTYMKFPWTELYAAQNEGEAAVVDYAMAQAEVAELSLFDLFGVQLYAASPGAIDLLSLFSALQAYNSGNSYGGLTADTSPQGVAWAPNIAGRINSTGGPFSWDMLQATYGACTYGNLEPDLIVTTQALYNKMVTRAIPAQRWRSDDLKKVFGAEGIGYNRADVMVDQHCPSGDIFVLNTKYWKLVINRNRNFIRRSRAYGLGGFGIPVFNDSKSVDQIVVQTQFVNQAPRTSGYISSVS
jgi:hypothetical protein